MLEQFITPEWLTVRATYTPKELQAPIWKDRNTWTVKVDNWKTQKCVSATADTLEEAVAKLKGLIFSGREVIFYGQKKSEPPPLVASKDGSWKPLFNW